MNKEPRNFLFVVFWYQLYLGSCHLHFNLAVLWLIHIRVFWMISQIIWTIRLLVGRGRGNVRNMQSSQAQWWGDGNVLIKSGKDSGTDCHHYQHWLTAKKFPSMQWRWEPKWFFICKPVYFFLCHIIITSHGSIVKQYLRWKRNLISVRKSMKMLDGL